MLVFVFILFKKASDPWLADLYEQFDDLVGDLVDEQLQDAEYLRLGADQHVVQELVMGGLSVLSQRVITGNLRGES